MDIALIMQTKDFLVKDSLQMLALGQAFAKCIQAPLLIFLQGQLGAGKTTWARGLLRGLGYLGTVKSPTYTLVEPYQMEVLLYHFDLYRLHSADELEMIGMDDYLQALAICVIEWPENAQAWLPVPDLACTIAINDQQRKVSMTAHSQQGNESLNKLVAQAAFWQ